MNEYLYRDRMSVMNFTGLFSTNTNNLQSTPTPVQSYKSIAAALMQKKSVQIPEVSTGRTLTYQESLEAAKSIYHSFDMDKIQAVQKTINIGAAIQDNIDRDSMSMSDYKLYIDAKIKSLPMDYTHQDDTEIINISDAGWQRMKSDENYEAWVLGYLKQDFLFHNPWYGVGSVRGNFVVENFGASVNEHHGMSEAKIDPDKIQDDNAAERRRKKRKMLQELEEEQYLQRRQIAEANARIAELKADGNFFNLSQVEIPESVISSALIITISM